MICFLKKYKDRTQTNFYRTTFHNFCQHFVLFQYPSTALETLPFWWTHRDASLSHPWETHGFPIPSSTGKLQTYCLPCGNGNFAFGESNEKQSSLLFIPTPPFAVRFSARDATAKFQYLKDTKIYLWTHRESNSGLCNANAPVYHLPMGPSHNNAFRRDYMQYVSLGDNALLQIVLSCVLCTAHPSLLCMLHNIQARRDCAFSLTYPRLYYVRLCVFLGRL